MVSASRTVRAFSRAFLSEKNTEYGWRAPMDSSASACGPRAARDGGAGPSAGLGKIMRRSFHSARARSSSRPATSVAISSVTRSSRAAFSARSR